jgi:hypothetical protein
VDRGMHSRPTGQPELALRPLDQRVRQGAQKPGWQSWQQLEPLNAPLSAPSKKLLPKPVEE